MSEPELELRYLPLLKSALEAYRVDFSYVEAMAKQASIVLSRRTDTGTHIL